MADCLWYRFKRDGDSSRFHSNMLTEYSKPVSRWLEEFPAEQLHVIQYERLTDDAQQLDSLRNLTTFLGEGGGRRGEVQRVWCGQLRAERQRALPPRRRRRRAERERQPAE